MGSNPTQSIESSVRIPNQEKNSIEYTTVYLGDAGEWQGTTIASEQETNKDLSSILIMKWI